MIDSFDNYKFRCSSLGKIISKSGKMTQGVETYLRECFIGEVYGIKKEISSKYLSKGLFEEETGISLLNDIFYNGKLLLKNKERKEDLLINGETDCLSPDKIIHDIKNAWDLFTFAKAELSWDYEWQIKGYCQLWKVTKGRLFYCINNTPEHIIVEEEKRHFWSGGFLSMEDEKYLTGCEEIRKKHNHDRIPMSERFKFWDVNYTEADRVKIESSVVSARGYMNKLLEDHYDMIIKNLEIIKKNKL